MKKWIKNDNGSILLEVLGGMTILLILSLSFTAIVTQASTLFRRASVNSREWEKIFVKMENKNYTTSTVPTDTSPPLPTADGNTYKIKMKLGNIKEGDVVLAKKADGTRPGMSETTLVREVTFTPELMFRQYEHTIQTAKSAENEKVYAYRIMKK